jgi:NADH-quinone oxidoreductase subunit J
VGPSSSRNGRHLSRFASPSFSRPRASVKDVSPTEHNSNIRSLARDLFSAHVLAFELTSVLLVIAVVGTVLLARRAPKSNAETPT